MFWCRPSHAVATHRRRHCWSAAARGTARVLRPGRCSPSAARRAVACDRVLLYRWLLGGYDRTTCWRRVGGTVWFLAGFMPGGGGLLLHATLYFRCCSPAALVRKACHRSRRCCHRALTRVSTCASHAGVGVALAVAAMHCWSPNSMTVRHADAGLAARQRLPTSAGMVVYLTLYAATVLACCSRHHPQHAAVRARSAPRRRAGRARGARIPAAPGPCLGAEAVFLVVALLQPRSP